tara:strand:+ start:16049 stop:16828 length:780 start_codon:yes stop_codon:yes gene_type:complete
MTAHMLANEAAENPRAVVGANQPPPEPFDLSAKEIGDLYEECALWADGKPIETDEQAADAAALLRLMQAAKDRADERRVEEKRPHDDAAAAVQEKYAPLVADTKKVKGKAVRAIETMKALIGAHLAKKAAEQKRIADEARAEADRQREAAQKAVREVDRTNLAEREAAEKQLADAQAAEAEATKLGKQRAQAKGFAGRAVSTTTRYVPTITDKWEFARWIWVHRPDDMTAFLARMADEVARTEKRDVDGLKVEPKQVAI